MNIVITGATSGIGKELAVQYAKAGHKVFALGRNTTSLEVIDAKLSIVPISIDVTAIKELRIVADKINKQVTHIDLVILNAGTCEYVDIQTFSNDLFRRVMEVNFFGMVNCIEVFLPLLRAAPKPHLVGVASMAYYLPLSRSEAYGASKAAVNYLLETLAIDLRADGIDVTVVNPGFVETPLTQKNDFPMPFIVPVDKAVKIIINGIEKRKAEVCFPHRLTIIMKLLSLLPRMWWRKLGLIFKK